MTEHAVLMISYPFPPASMAGVHRTLRFIKYLPEHGWKPLVVAPNDYVFDPTYCDRALESAIPVGTVVERTHVYLPVRAIENAVKSIRAWWRPAEKGKVNRAETVPAVGAESPERTRPSRLKRFGRDTLNLLFSNPDPQIGWFFPAVKAALKLIRRHQVHVIYSTGPPHSSHLIAVALRAITRLPMVLDFRDPWSRGPWGYGRGVTPRWLQPVFERLCVRWANRVILNTAALRDEFVKAYPAETAAKFVAIPNGIDPEFCCHGEAYSKRSDNTANETAVICHPGTVYGRRALQPVLAAMEKLIRSGYRVQFQQIGSMENEAAVKSYAQSLGLNGAVLFCGRLPHEETLRRMSNADVFLLSQPGTGLQIPSKIFEMIPFGRPIVALTEPAGATADVINEYALGSVVQPSDSSAIATAISRNIEIARELKSSSGWQKAMEAFNGCELTRKLAMVFDDSLEKRWS